MPRDVSATQPAKDRLVLQQSRPSPVATLSALALTVASVIGILWQQPLGWLGTIVFGTVAILLLTGHYCHPGRLELTAEGFRKSGLLRTTTHQWTDVSTFVVKSPGYVFPLSLPKQVILYVRTVTAGIYDEDRWRFEAHGEVQPFEQLERYQGRRIRDRFDRGLLVRYLEALGISADDPSFFGGAVLFESLRRSEWQATIAEVRQERAPVDRHR